MAYTPRQVANAFLAKAKPANTRMSHLRAQKLVYFLHAWSLALCDSGSFVSEHPQAWPYGPIFESLYHQIRSLGSDEVGAYLVELNPETGKLVGMLPSQADTAFYDMLDQVWGRYAGFSDAQLSALAHEAGSPWEQAREAHQKWIEDVAIKAYYQGLYDRATIARRKERAPHLSLVHNGG